MTRCQLSQTVLTAVIVQQIILHESHQVTILYHLNLIEYYTTIEDLPNGIKFKWHKQVTGSQDDIVTDHSIIV